MSISFQVMLLLFCTNVLLKNLGFLSNLLYKYLHISTIFFPGSSLFLYFQTILFIMSLCNFYEKKLLRCNLFLEEL